MRIALALLGLLTGLGGAPSVPPPAIRVLFVGNSLTAANDLPKMVTAIAKSAGVGPVEAGYVLRPGFSLEDHWNAGMATGEIARGAWNVVVLQQGPSSQPDSRVLLSEYVRRFDREIRRAGAKTALYMVWPSRARYGDFDGVSASYTLAAREVHALLIPAGDAWRAAWRRDPALALYGEDLFHPSPLGSYLAALAVAEVITQRSLVGAAPPSGSPAPTPAIEALLRTAVSDTVERIRTATVRAAR